MARRMANAGVGNVTSKGPDGRQRHIEPPALESMAKAHDAGKRAMLAKERDVPRRQGGATSWRR